jgi:hypothetical protein
MKTLTLFSFFNFLYENSKYLISILINNNKYLLISIFLSLFLIFYIPFYIQYKKYIKLIHGKDYDAFIYFNSLRITNIYITFFNVFLYILFNIIFILYLRSLSLGFTKDLKFINLYDSFTLLNTGVLISFLLFLYAYYQFTDVIFFKEITKLHIFYSKKTMYVIFTLRYKRFLTKTYLLEPIIMTLWYCLNSDYRKDYDESKKKWQKFRQKYNEKQSVLGLGGYLQEKIRENLYEWCKDSLIRLKVLTVIYKTAKWIRTYISEFFKEMSLVIVIIVLIYDINQGKLYYIYYALFIYTIILMYRKLQEFLWGLDIGPDSLMHELLYEGPYFSDMMYNENKILENNEKDPSILSEDELKEYYERSIMQSKQAAVLPSVIEMLYYFLNNMKVEYMRKNKDFNYHTVPIWPIRRFILLITAFISIYYLSIVKYIEVIILNIHIQNTNLIFGLLLIYTIKLWYTTGYIDTSTRFTVSHTKYGKKYNHYIFLFLTLTVSLLAFIIFIKSKLILMSNEIIINTSIITVIDHYTIEDKIRFLFQYLEYIMQDLEIPARTQEIIFNIFNNIDYKNMINNDTSLELLKDYTFNFIIEIINYNTRFIEKVNNFVNEYIKELNSIEIPNEPYFKDFLRNILLITNTTVLFIKSYNIIKITINLIFDQHTTSFTIIKEIIKNIFKE